ncbi:uncharacterized protein LOC131015870 isoform X1 [Salvia miltiorrhiza]|uniref:uncharacterized protein LOC131015870 isoform X1 n=1 Tax=Salvia miltiorrhiza TaxID=226208 RepID=UPI0025ACAFBA|nr:uncharacterized protein LOC131015870 isoform X1 [Salvia miltiorrhiza]
MVLSNDYDLLNPPAELEKRKHKLKRLVQSPNSFFMNHCVQPLPNSCCVRKLPDGAVPTDWRPRQAHRGLLLPKKGRLRNGFWFGVFIFIIQDMLCFFM